MEIVLYGIMVVIGILAAMTIGLAISFFRNGNWMIGILAGLLAAEMIFMEYMIISKAIAEKIIGG